MPDRLKLPIAQLDFESFTDDELRNVAHQARYAQDMLERRKYKKDQSDTQTCILILNVPAPRSGNIVDHLTQYSFVKEAAAVYTDTDVIAVLDGQQSEVNGLMASLNTLSPPVEAGTTQLVDIDKIRQGRGYERGRFQGNRAIFAFVRLLLSPHQPFELAVNTILDRFEHVRLIYTAKHQTEIVLQVFAKDKSDFDGLVMDEIQKSTMFKSTRTYITINALHWSDSGIPRTRNEFMQREKSSPVFLGFAEADARQAIEFAENLEKDSGVSIWHYKKIPSGTDDWIRDVDNIICKAPAFIFFITDSFLDSGECSREFGSVDVLTREKPKTMCVFIAAKDLAKKLDDRFRRRQYIDGSGYWGYRQILEWLENTI